MESCSNLRWNREPIWPPASLSTPPALGALGLKTDLLQPHHFTNNSSCSLGQFAYIHLFLFYNFEDFCCLAFATKPLKNVPSLLSYFVRLTHLLNSVSSIKIYTK